MKRLAVGLLITIMLLSTSIPADAAKLTKKEKAERHAIVLSEAWALVQPSGYYTFEEVKKILADKRIVPIKRLVDKFESYQKKKNPDQPRKQDYAKSIYMSSQYQRAFSRAIEEAKRIYRENLEILKFWESNNHVDPATVVTIYWIESRFGSNTGKHRAINGYYTYAIYHPDEARRLQFAQEIGYFLLYCHEKSKDVFSVYGSEAGAMELPQFLASSYYKKSADGDGDGIVDLDNEKDALASIARHLQYEGYKAGDNDRVEMGIFGYNNCKRYVYAVKTYAKKLKDKL